MSNLKAQKAELFAIDSGVKNGQLQQGYKLPKNMVTVQSVIPAPIQSMMATQFKSVGLNFDVSKIALNKDNRQSLKNLRETVELIQNNSKLLPEIATCLKKAMKAATKQAKFNADIAKSAMKEQLKIDNAHADVLLGLMGYTEGRNKIQARLERKKLQMEKRHEARTRYYDTTWGKEAQTIDAIWANVTDVALEKHETKKLKSNAKKQRKVESEQWLRDAE